MLYIPEKQMFLLTGRRAKIANDVQADLFISIHCDAHTSNAYGAGTFVLGFMPMRNLRLHRKKIL